MVLFRNQHEFLPNSTRMVFNTPGAKPAGMQHIPANNKQDTKTGFLPQWSINQMAMKYAGSSTTAARIKPRYMLSLKLVALILIP